VTTQLDFFARLTTSITSAFQGSALRETKCAREETAAVLRDRARSWLQSAGYVSLAGRVDVQWNSRMRSTAGMACASKCLVTLNPLIRQFGAEEVERTLKHELAHLIAHHRAGRRRIAPHGREWQQACLELKLLDESRCHDLPLPRRRVQRRHRYRCIHCGVEVQRVKPFRRKTACLSCCRAHARGQYDARFCFVRLPPS